MKKSRKQRRDKGKSRVKKKPEASIAVQGGLATSESNPLQFIYKDEYPRDPLSEARDYGISFAFCKRQGNNLTTVGPLSPCKDYLNDQVFSEATGKPFQAYGYSAKKEGLFECQDKAYIVMGILGYKHSDYGSEQPIHTKNLSDNHEEIAKFINHFEAMIGMKSPGMTKIFKVADNRYVAECDKFWAKYTYLVSFWTLLARFAVESGWNGTQGNPYEALKSCKTGDGMIVRGALPKFDKMVSGTVPVQDFTASKFWHNEGIISFKGFEAVTPK